MTNHLLKPLFETFDSLAKEARFYAIAGELSKSDLNGLYVRASRKHGCTPADAQRWIEAR